METQRIFRVRKSYSYNWDTDPEVRRAVQCVVDGDSFHMAYKKTGIGAQTIKKFYTMYVKDTELFDNRKKRAETTEADYDTSVTVFTKDQDAALMKCLKEFEFLFDGVTEKECRMLAYQMVISEDMKIPVGWKHGMASIAWLTSFRLRYSSFMLELKKPDRICSKSSRKPRGISWEKKTVANFYDNLEKYIQQFPEIKDNKRIYSLDEAYTSLFLDNKTAADRDCRNDLFTVCCFICADGTNLPPVVVKPYRSSVPCSDIFAGGVPLTSPRGQMTPDLFTEVMHYFVKHSHSSLSNPSILIMDTDLCHLSYAAVALAKESGVQLLTLHPHVSDLLQPLQGQLFESFYTSLNDSLEGWLILKGDVVTCKASDIGKLIHDTYTKIMTHENILNSFKKCGISPFDRDLFTDSDYISCLSLVEQPCIECRVRDDRSRKLDWDQTAVSVDKPGPSQVPSGESQVEELNKPGDGGESSQTQGTKIGEVHTDIINMTSPRTKAGQELDKLKRRLIRSIARLMKEKKTEEEVWAEMKKECGENCQALWMRMKSLTLKKLKRLIEADDRNELVPAVARMTLTDWLLYDLVLVHDKIDVINRSNKGESKVLNNLFSLVQRFQVEGRFGDDLADAWTAATVSYNSKGHQCSPMLMQRRWYQVKELTRHKLYQFWFNYRGNEKLLAMAKQDPPTALQRAVSLRYPEIITKPFPSWEERIEKKQVIMPEEFEIRMYKKDLMKPPDETVPDVEIIENKIDTITVESDSDFDDDHKSETSAFPIPEALGNAGTSQIPLLVQVKTEPQDPYDDIDITEHPVYPEKRDRFQDAIEKLTIEEDRVAMSHVNTDEAPQEDYVMPLITNVVGAVNETITSELANNRISIDLENQTNINAERNEILQNTSVSFNSELESVINTFDDNSQQSIVIDDDEDDILIPDVAQNRSDTPDINRTTSNVIDITSPIAKRAETNNGGMISARSAYSDTTDTLHPRNNEVCPKITAVLSGSLVKAKMEMDAKIINNENVDVGIPEVLQDSEIMEDIITIEPEKEMLNSGGAAIITNVADDGFEFADDGIEYDEEHNDRSELSESPEKTNITTENEDTPKFDLKLLMHPVVYTTKLDDMEVFKGRSFFDTIDEKCLFDKIFFQSKPVSTKSVSVEQIKAQNDEETNSIQVTEDNSEEFDDDLFQNESSNDSDRFKLEITSLDDSRRVKLSSSLLQKPRSRRYNPIQLCKNPDFNTRLKRLPLGFYSSERNRVFLKACKPMTIDLSKAFESKLINGTMYLKPSDSIVTAKLEEIDKSESTASVTPSAVAVQSLMDTTDVDKILQDELRKRMLERNKTITLPNISLVRHINQHLLMAEVAPIMTQVEKSTYERSQTLYNINLENPNNINTQTKETRNETPTNPFRKSLQISEITNQSSATSVKQTTPLINSDKSTNSTTDTATDSLLPMLNNDKPKEDKANEKQKKKYEKLNVNKPLWLSKYFIHDSKPNESLLTIDTLYKMLNALDPSSVDYNKPKPKTKPKTNKVGRPLGSTTQNKPTGNLDSSAKIKTNSGNTVEQSPLNLLPNTPSVTKPIITSKKAKNNSSLPKRQKNCCWARSKINKINGVVPRESKHKCPLAHCRCCCREVLRQTEINNEIKLLESMQLRDQFDETIEQVVNQARESQNVIPSVTLVNPIIVQGTHNQPVHENLTNVKSSVAHVRNPKPIEVNTQLLPQSKQNSVGINDGIQAYVDEDDDVTLINNTPQETQPLEIIDTDISENESEVTIDLVDDDDNRSEIQTPMPKIRIYAGASSANRPIRDLTRVKKNQWNQARPPMVPIAPLPRSPSPLPLVSPITPLKNFPKNTSTALSPAPLPNVIPRGKKVEAKVMVAKTSTVVLNSSLKDLGASTLPCSCKPNVVVDQLSATLVIDGSIECPQHSRSRISKETRIYLNRRHMSAAARPFYVGKNKILLTNIIPRKAQPPPPPSAPQTPLELPAGVQVVLLADGTLSYLVDPGVELTVEEKNAMPIILASVLEQVKASGIALPLNDFTTPENTTLNVTIDDKNDENSNVSSEHIENDKLDGEILSTAPIPDPKNISSNTAILQTEQKEPSQEPSNQEKSMHGNKKDSNKVSLVPTDSEGSTSNDTLVGKNNTVMDVTNTESLLCSKSALNAKDLAPSTENFTSETQKKFDPAQGAENPNDLDKNNATNIMVENQKISYTAENVENNNNAEYDVAVESVEIKNRVESDKNNHTAKNDEISNVLENDKMNNTVENSQMNNETSNGNTNIASSSRNLLSDLMEMSGILEEDVNPIQQQPVHTSEATKPLNIDISQNSSVQPLSPIPEKHEICARINEKIYNLNPITSFSELKYACDNKGLFFKLDLSNGLIVPINVCIQKTPELAATSTKPSEVIDLTDDQSVTIEDSTTNTQPVTEVDPSPKLTPETDNQSKIKRRKLHIIKPKDITLMLNKPRGRGRPRKLKTIRSENEIDETTLQQKPSTTAAFMEEKKIALMKRLSNNLKPLKFHPDKRTPIILRKNSMSKSNTSFLTRISNFHKKIENEIYLETEYLLDSSEDSDDDEPLAKIAKKMKTIESSEVTSAEESQEVRQGIETEDDNVDFEDAIDAISSVEPPTILNSLLNDGPVADSLLEEVDSQDKDDSITDPIMADCDPVPQLQDDPMAGPVPTQLVLSGAALQQPLPAVMHDSLNFVANESEEDSDDDCILGV